MQQHTTTSWRFPYCPVAPDWRLDWEGIQRQFHWIRAMDGVEQDAVHHAEGNVLIHTGMVIAALTGLDAWRTLEEQERNLVFAATLLHDIGKPRCTVVGENGRISSRGHARAGEYMVRRLLWSGEEIAEIPPFVLREQIARLVCLHGLPLQFLNQQRPERALIAASMSVRLDYLALLAEADVRGRICVDQQELWERVVLFREYAQELSCYAGPRQFASGYSRFMYFRHEQRDVEYAAYDDTTFEVVVMAGLPGVGKDTWIARHLSGWPVVSLDEIRKEMHISAEENQGPIIQTAKERARILMRQRQSFVWNATNVTRTLRGPLIDLFVSYGARVRIIYLEAPLATILSRNRERAAMVPEAVIYRLLDKLEVPDLTEASSVQWEQV